ncbi:YkgJ family cysteine cluster protein [Amylibacter marinus]|nr:YkgJ family cysteine cluster protein [Amylibacter marinus]
METNAQSHPCLMCGLCCNGSLFKTAKLYDTDNTDLIEVTDDKNGEARFRLPCKNFSTKCEIYDKERPRTCVQFKCKTLIRFENGKISHKRALEIISQMQVLVRKVLETIPNGDNAAIVSVSNFVKDHKMDMLDLSFRRQNGQKILLVHKYRKMVKKHFIVGTKARNGILSRVLKNRDQSL